MVTDLFGSIVADTLSAVRSEAFFALDRGAREARLRDALGAEYPVSIMEWLAVTDAERFASDVLALLPSLGSRTSLFRDVRRLGSNGLFAAGLAFLSSGLRVDATDIPASTILGRFLAAISESDLRRTTLVREAQELLHAATGSDSAILHVAAPIDPDAARRLFATLGDGGLASLRVYPDLLGGARMFANGSVHDASWAARLSSLFPHDQQ